jgi:hypothetical protein
MQNVGNLLCFKNANHPQSRRFERLQCSLHDPAGEALSPALHELSKGSYTVHVVELGCMRFD